jgi:hypothetical protein
VTAVRLAQTRVSAPGEYFTAALTAACGNQRDQRDLSLSRQWVSRKTGTKALEADQRVGDIL